MPQSDTPWCLGTALTPIHTPEDGRPVFDLPPALAGHRVPDALILRSRADFERAVRGVADAAGQPLDEPSPLSNSDAPPGVDWVREGTRRDGGRPMAPPGFLDDATIADPMFGSAAPLDALIESARCVVVVGEPGIGKTTEAERLLARGGRRLDSRSVLGSDDVAVLDGFDEGPESTLGDLREWLAALPDPPPRLRAFTRDDIRLSRLVELLRKRYGPTDVTVVELLPLRRTQVEQKYGERRVNAIDAAGAQALASRPLTLTWVMDSRDASGDIITDPYELVRAAILARVTAISKSRIASSTSRGGSVLPFSCAVPRPSSTHRALTSS